MPYPRGFKDKVLYFLFYSDAALKKEKNVGRNKNKLQTLYSRSRSVASVVHCESCATPTSLVYGFMSSYFCMGCWNKLMNKKCKSQSL